MANNYKVKTYSNSVTGTSQALFTASASTTLIKSILVNCDKTTPNVNAILRIKKSGGAEKLIKKQNITVQNSSYEMLYDVLPLESGDAVYAQSDDTDIVWIVCWVENTTVQNGQSIDFLSDVDTSGKANGDVLTYNSTTGNWEADAPTGGGGNTFSTISVATQSPIVADSTSDTLSIAAGTGISLTTDAASDTLTITNTVTAPNTFGAIAVNTQSTLLADSTADTLTLVAGTGISITTDATADSITITNSATGANAFGNVAVAGQTTVAADSTNDTLTIAAGTGITLTTDATTDTVTITNSVTAPNTFGTIAVATQSNVVADSTTDTLTFAAAGGMTITTDATTDTITLDSARLDDDDVTLSGLREIDLNGENLNFRSSGFDILLVEADGVSMTDPVIRNYTGGTGGKITLTEATTNGGSSITIKAPDSLTVTTNYTLPSADGTSGQVLATNAAGGLSWTTRAANSFETIAVAGQSSIVADTHIDTLTIAAGTGITLTTDASTDTLTITNSVTAPNTFGTIAVAGQSNVVADSTTDTLTLAAGSNITLTTDATTDTITITSTGGAAAAGSTGQIQYNSGGAFAAEAALYYDATNNRLSVGGNTSPTGTLVSRGAGNTTGIAFRIESSAGSERLQMLDEGTMTITEANTGMAASRCTLALVGTKADYQRGSLEIRHTNVSNPFTSIFSANTCGQVVANDFVTGGIAVQGISTSSASAAPFFFGGIHGSTAPTQALMTFQGQKNNGSGGYTTLANTEKLVRFRNLNTEIIAILASRAVGIGNTAPTSTTSLTVRGQGTGTNNTLLIENSAGTARFTVRDDGGYAFAGGTVGVAQTGYTTFTNLTTDRTCDANATTVEELADILGTLIEDLKTKGIIAA